MTNNSSNELDLRARVTVGKEVAPRLRLYGIGTLGYSWIFDFVTDTSGAEHNVHGFIWSLGGGIAYALNPKLALTGELSYQLGYQGGTLSGVSFTAAADFLAHGQ